ncbi:MAG TPA: L-seryl-tRNA(Sec) selenium transferase [Solirubrobacteraceae bacterium]|jgi:L-seryl-tRNA(Ser) seleniumtransferase
MGGRREAELRALPAVHELAAQLDAPHGPAVAAARRAIDEQRALLVAGGRPQSDEPELLDRARALLVEGASPSLRQVINATGVIVHTNLGRAPLAEAAREAVLRVAGGYSNLELDLESGQRGSRHSHVHRLLRELTGAGDAIVVNNGAGAVLLAAAALAGPGRAIVVSRGQLIEIGGGFRIPDVIGQSGATMVEVGTTNRTNRRDYERALESSSPPVGAILRVHQSNFRTLGFVEDVSVEELCDLGVPVIDDVGSGVLAGDLGIMSLGEEPDLRRSVAAGAALVCCSGDKLLGGPQAGLLLGSSEAIAAARSHPLARALRIDKLSLAALEATLQLYRDPARARIEIPVLAMLDQPEAALAARAERLCEAIGERAELVRTSARVGGGALPLTELDGPAVAMAPPPDPVALAQRLRDLEPPVVARIHDGRLLLDPRTLSDDEADVVAVQVGRALAGE